MEWVITKAIQLIRIIGAGVCDLIYWLISKLFQLFMIVSQLNILSSDEIRPIYERVTLILTIVMVFYITFEFVKYVVQPETMTDKEKGVANIVKRMIIAIVLIAFVPRIFTGAYDLQNRLIKNQVFSKIILGEQNINFDTFGSAFSADMLGVFYGVDEEYCSGSDFDASCKEAQENVENNLNKLRNGGKVTFMPGLNKTKKFEVDGSNEDVFPVRFDGLLAIIVGGVILYLVVLYTIDVGTRYAQLIFLQIMSPIAIIGYISPKKDNIFSKWLKQCITTYLDLFIRLTIIYFILLIIDVLGDSFNSGSLFAGIEGVEGYKNLAYIALIMGLLVFAGKAPKMIGELLPVSGGAASIGYGLKGGDRFTPTANGVKKTWNAGRRTVGGTAGAIGGLVKGFKDGKKQKAWSALKAGYQGLKAGAGKGGGIRKGLDAARSSVNKDIDIADKGGTPLGSDIRGGHFADIATQQDREITEYKYAETTKKSMKSAIAETKIMKSADAMIQGARSPEERVMLEGRKKAIEKAIQQGAQIGETKTIKYKLADGTDKTEDVTLLEKGDKPYIERLDMTAGNFKKNIMGTALENFKVTIEVDEKDANGQIIGKKEETKALKDFKEDEIRKYMGDIEAQAGTKIEELQNSSEYKEAHANGQGSSGKSGK